MAACGLDEKLFTYLLERAAAPDEATRPLAAMLARAAGMRLSLERLGWPRAALDRLLARCFPGAAAASLRTALEHAPREFPREAEEIPDLVVLLLEHAAVRDETTLWLARAVALACLGEQHLWQDMRLPHRAALTTLLGQYFPSLVRRNTQDMKWKRFLYKQLCEKEAIACRAPQCTACEDYRDCFGPETVPESVGVC
ncbi:nitrogen fixation protein NifQ [Tepidiphilus baoligensis]|uniref:Nitrogen fixation protein NifQ n=1 Tax=Tepidiphilus baoligensis TaxID=2698687 RepID=A0ABX1QMA2_9PROT|nr:nitrogen fixation protein NifQ [Tepidiphilus baoligensis]NMH16210.1 nitrogen fixation protein NifQ [Tepidiphilus baoligensis]